MTHQALKTLTGLVVRQPYAVGSKSEHEAVCLKTPRGTYRLRRLEGDPLHDPELEALVGTSIRATGELVHGTTLIVHHWTKV
jgi:hypothetical protein